MQFIRILRRWRNALALSALGAVASCAVPAEPGDGDPANECGAGQAICGGACVSTQIDPLSCGACGTSCSPGQSCSGGACVCAPGTTLCGAACSNLGADGQNCGACGTVCSAGLVCSLGTCASSCAAELTQCGSSCVDVATNATNCGGCDQACQPGEMCVDGSCACAPGQQLCGASCSDTTSDPGNCGTCGNVCTNGGSCVASQCTGGGTGGAGSGGSGSGGAASGGAGSGGASSGGAGSGGASSGGSDNGTCTNVRPTGTDWDEATCNDWATQTSQCSAAWMIDSGYCDQSCGRCNGTGSGGAGSGGAGSGGAGSGGAGSGGSGSGGAPSTCSSPNGQVCNNQIGTHCGYTFEYWKDQGTGCMTNTASGFDVTWNNINNLLGRKGLRPGSANNVVTYSANYQPNGNSYLCVYGWSTGPLVEYYIVDSWGSWRPPGSGHKGTVTTDGGTYDVYQTQRVNQPSIEGTRTFYQFWSVRTAKRSSGTITVKNHFNAWAALGMSLGNLYEVSMTVEGYQSSGTASVTMSIQ